MITTYAALTMGQYQEIDRITRAGGDELEVQVAILSILTGKPGVGKTTTIADILR